MRLAFSGSHATGKSAILSELRPLLPQFAFVDEAYYYLIDEGHGFGIKPTLEDMESQLRRAIALARDSHDSDIVFERSPVDYMAYLVALNADAETLRFWLEESRDVLSRLDAVIFVPIEPRDRIHVSSEDLPKLRKRVDLELRDILVEDSWDLDLNVLEVVGSPADRAHQVLSWINVQEPLVP